MAYCKKFIILFLILFILLFNFNQVFASEVEEVSVTSLQNIVISSSSNYFTSGSGRVQYFEVEPGYIYTLTYTLNDVVPVVVSNEIPANNVTFTRLTELTQASPSYSYISNDSGIVILTYRGSSYVTVTRQKIENLDGAIGNLVDNVGPNALWGVFGSGIDFVFVIVIVAFGIFIIYKLISGLAKGKSKV